MKLGVRAEQLINVDAGRRYTSGRTPPTPCDVRAFECGLIQLLTEQPPSVSESDARANSRMTLLCELQVAKDDARVLTVTSMFSQKVGANT
jgi:hypothetical protein